MSEPSPYPVLTDSDRDRFWSRVAIMRIDKCWLWQGGTFDSGYGGFWCQGRTLRAHRVSYELHEGPISPGLLVCPSCDVPSCCNFHHLWLGTTAQNNADCDNKGRLARGQGNGMARLTDEQVAAILRDPRKQRTIAADYPVGKSTIAAIKRRLVWRHVPE